MRVYVGSCVGRTVEPLHAQSMVPILRDGRYAYFPQIGDALIDRARGMSATYFLRHTDADVHLSIDSDIVDFRKEAIDEMCEQAFTYDIVGAVYLCRSVARTFPATFFEDKQTIEFAFDSTPQPVRWAATGCLAVHRRVFEKLAETLPLLHEKDGPRAFYPFYLPMIYDMPDEKIELSEDYAFCERARQAGFIPHVNPAVRVGHMGPYVYRLEDMAQRPLKPQPLKISHVERYWRIECGDETESPEDLGRLPDGEGEEIRQKFEELEKQVTA